MNLITTKIAMVSEKGDNPVFGESVTEIILSDEAAGFFVTLQSLDPEAQHGQVKLTLEEIQTAARVAKEMIDYAERVASQ